MSGQDYRLSGNVAPENPNLNQFEQDFYEPTEVKVKRNSIASPLTFNLVKVVATDNNEHAFMSTTPLVVEDCTILAASTNGSGIVYIGPQGNSNFPLAAGASYRTSKIDVNVFFYSNSNLLTVYMLYSGSPSLQLEAPAKVLDVREVK